MLLSDTLSHKKTHWQRMNFEMVRLGHTKAFENGSNGFPTWRSRFWGKHYNRLAVRINGPEVRYPGNDITKQELSGRELTRLFHRFTLISNSNNKWP